MHFPFFLPPIPQLRAIRRRYWGWSFQDEWHASSHKLHSGALARMQHSLLWSSFGTRVWQHHNFARIYKDFVVVVNMEYTQFKYWSVACSVATNLRKIPAHWVFTHSSIMASQQSSQCPQTSIPWWPHFNHKDISHLDVAFLIYLQKHPGHSGIFKKLELSWPFPHERHNFINLHVFFSFYCPTPEMASLSRNFHVRW